MAKFVTREKKVWMTLQLPRFYTSRTIVIGSSTVGLKGIASSPALNQETTFLIEQIFGIHVRIWQNV